MMMLILVLMLMLMMMLIGLEQAAETCGLQEHCSLPPRQDGERQQTGDPIMLQEEDPTAVPQPTWHPICWPQGLQGLMYSREIYITNKAKAIGADLLLVFSCPEQL